MVEKLNKQTANQIESLDVMRKGKKVEDIVTYMHSMRETFDFHFFLNSVTQENPYFKIDSLVWSCIYHSKIPRYHEKVYKMGEYMVKHFKYVQTLSYEDIEKGNIDWNPY